MNTKAIKAQPTAKIIVKKILVSNINLKRDYKIIPSGTKSFDGKSASHSIAKKE